MISVPSRQLRHSEDRDGETPDPAHKDRAAAGSDPTTAPGGFAPTCGAHHQNSGRDEYKSDSHQNRPRNPSGTESPSSRRSAHRIILHGGDHAARRGFPSTDEPEAETSHNASPLGTAPQRVRARRLARSPCTRDVPSPAIPRRRARRPQDLRAQAPGADWRGRCRSEPVEAQHKSHHPEHQKRDHRRAEGERRQGSVCLVPLPSNVQTKGQSCDSRDHLRRHRPRPEVDPVRSPRA